MQLKKCQDCEEYYPSWVESCPLCENHQLKNRIAELEEELNINQEDFGGWSENPFMIKISGKSFRCECGCNVFRKGATNENMYKCNACNNVYEGS